MSRPKTLPVPSQEIARLAEIAEATARAAGALVREGFQAPRNIETKSAPMDLVTETDRAADDLIRTRLQADAPGQSILTEEGEFLTGSEHPEICWVVDPLDGTANFASGYPQVAVSIAAVHVSQAGSEPRRSQGEGLVGVVYDPIRDELFSAQTGRGARLNGAPLGPIADPDIGDSMIATGFPYDRRERPDLYLDAWRAMLLEARDIRRAGAAALDLVWVAAGRVAAFWEWGLQPWDIAAGTLIVREAGGVCTDFDGGPLFLDSAETLAAPTALGRRMREILVGVRDAHPPRPDR